MTSVQPVWAIMPVLRGPEVTEAALADYPDEVAPYKLLAGAAAAMAEVATDKLKLVNGRS